jgi:hypothetical protein
VAWHQPKQAGHAEGLIELTRLWEALSAHQALETLRQPAVSSDDVNGSPHLIAQGTQDLQELVAGGRKRAVLCKVGADTIDNAGNPTREARD